MPTTSGDKLCPICDSPLQPGSKKCSFCGTDLSIFDIDIEQKKEAPAPAPPSPPKPSVEARIDEIFRPSPAPSVPSPEPAPIIVEQPKPEPTKAEPLVEDIPEPSPAPELLIEEEVAPAAETEVKAVPAPVKVESTSAKETPSAPPVHAEFFECPECKAHVPIEASICPSCGVMFAEEGETFQCPACNTLVSMDAKSCPGCGALFVEPEEAGQLPPQAVPEKIIVSAPEAPKKDLEPPIEEVEAARPPEKPKEEPKKGFGIGGFFKWGKHEEKAPKKEEKKPKAEEKKPAPFAPQRKPEVKVIRDLAKEEPPRSASQVRVAEAPAIEHPVVPHGTDKGSVLARMVAEMKPLFALASEREVDVSESKRLIDEAVVAGRERQADKAIELVQKSKASLMGKVDNHLSQVIARLNEEIKIARDFGGDISRPAAYMQEVSKARGSGDVEAAYVYVDKAKKELLPITGRYNESRVRITDLKRLIQNCEVFIVDTKEARGFLAEANKAFEMKDFDKVESIVKSANDGLFKAIPTRMTEELQKAKEDLIELKSKNVNITPMLTVLKSARGLMNSGDLSQAIKEMRDFKDMMKKAMG